MADYVPFSATPIQGRPWSFVAGVDAAIQDEQLRKAQAFALEQMMLQNRQREAELNRYTQMTPHEVDIRGFDAAYANAKKPFVGDLARGDVGDAQSRAAKGALDQASLPGAIDATNIRNRIAGLEGIARQFELIGSESPMMAQAEYQNFYQALPKQFQGMFPKAYDPTVPERIRRMSEWLKNNPEHQRATDIHRMDNTSREVIAKGHDLTNLEIARIQAEAAKEKASLSAGTRAKLENFITMVAEKVAAGTATPQERATAQWAAQILATIRAAGVATTADPNALLNLPARGTPTIPEAPGAPTPTTPQQEGMGLSREEVERMGARYDAAYEYAIIDGKLKRKKR